MLSDYEDEVDKIINLAEALLKTRKKTPMKAVVYNEEFKIRHTGISRKSLFINKHIRSD